jgi:hypothetical protein
VQLFQEFIQVQQSFLNQTLRILKHLKGRRKVVTFSGVMNDFGIVKSCQWYLTKKACTDFTAVITFSS